MASPWQLVQYDENGNPIVPDNGAQYDAASASEDDANRSPASAIPLMLTAKGRKNYNPSANSVATPKQSPKPNPVAMPTPQAPQQQSTPFPMGMNAMKQDVGWHPGFGNQLQDKNQQTEGQKQDIQHTIFESPERARLNMEQAMGQYAQPLRDEKGEIVKDADGNIVYDPNNTVTDPDHPYQQGMASVNAAKELLRQRMQYAPNQVDLSPLMALADAWSPKGDKSNLAASYHPHTYDQAAQSAMQYMDDLQKRQVDLAKEAQSGANNMRAGQQSNALTLQMLQSQMAGIGMGRGGFINPVNASNQWNNQVRQAFQKDDTDANNMNQLLKEVAAGNKIDDARIGIIRASADAHGRPNMAEVNNEAGSKALVDKASQAWDFLVHGTLTDDNRNLILQSLHTIAGYRQHVRDLQAQRLGNMGSSQYMQSPAQIGSNLAPSYVKMYDTTTGAPQKTAPASTNQPTLKDMLNEIVKSNAAKKGQ